MNFRMFLIRSLRNICIYVSVNENDERYQLDAKIILGTNLTHSAQDYTPAP